MSIDLDDEILQDFLVEAGEILELLSEQLVELEQSPQDNDLLNAVFRGFHTVKGGAGFLAIDPMVDTCHVCEDVFNVLRQGERSVSPALMDAVLQGLDCVQTMFADIQSGSDPTPADPALLITLKSFAVAESETTEVAVETEATEVTDDQGHDETDDEFEALLDAMDGTEGSTTDNDEITEDEFEALLDNIHGKGKHGGKPDISNTDTPSSTDSGDSDLITDEEFDQLLDELHGKGKGPSADQPPQPGASDRAGTDNRNDDLITDDEFDQLLDDLHGKGKGPTATGKLPDKDSQPSTRAEMAKDELITDDEFDQLLDELHGKGKGPTAETQKKPVAEASASAAKPATDKPATAKPAAKPAPAKPEVKQTPVPPVSPAKTAPAAKPAAPASAKPAAETSVRVDTERLDDIMNLVGELVLVRNRLQTLRSELAEGQVSQAITNLDMVTSDLQTSVMKTRMQPIKKVFGRFPRVVRDLSRQIKKEIKLEMIGEDTDLDKNLVEALADPLVHLVRNAVDHGVEMPDEREKKGKPREGRVILSASQEGDHILLTIEDDGAGMDPEVLRGKVVEKGLMDEESAARLDDKECFNLIFMAGFSTKEQISDISGRGVGMDVVKTRITQLNGSLDIDSAIGKGTVLTIKVPLTLAILPTLMIGLGKYTFALPLSNVNEIFELETRKTNVVDGQLMVMVRDKAVPLFYLSKWLLKPGESAKYGEGHGQVIIVQLANRMVGLVTDHVIGQEEVVIKPLGALLQGLAGFAGSTITGDGGIALIIDVQSLLKARARKGF